MARKHTAAKVADATDSAAPSSAPGTSEALASASARHASRPNWVRSQSSDTERQVRLYTNLPCRCPLHPPTQPEICQLRRATEYAQSLAQHGTYPKGALGVFAKDLSKTGAKTFFVDTFAGLAASACERNLAQVSGAHSRNIQSAGQPSHPYTINRDAVKQRSREHYYEVITDGNPCWLYFDLEFNQTANPAVSPEDVMPHFYRCLDAYFIKVFGCPCAPAAVLELDSSSPEKFSKHVIVKTLRDGRRLAFAHNGVLKRLVEDFVSGLRDRTTDRRGEDTANLFFYKALHDDNPGSCLVDTSVYSRNRCFRLLWSSKFGQDRPLRLTRGWAVWQPTFCQFLESLVSHVPVVTPLLGDCVPSARPSPENTQPRRLTSSTDSDHGDLPTLSSLQPLCDFLCAAWDAVRSQFETHDEKKATRVHRVVSRDCGRYLCFTLVNNRFCCNKGASHKRNSIYLVVDVPKGVFYQKCHDDVDCGCLFRSTETALPPTLTCSA